MAGRTLVNSIQVYDGSQFRELRGGKVYDSTAWRTIGSGSALYTSPTDWYELGGVKPSLKGVDVYLSNGGASMYIYISVVDTTGYVGMQYRMVFADASSGDSALNLIEAEPWVDCPSPFATGSDGSKVYKVYDSDVLDYDARIIVQVRNQYEASNVKEAAFKTPVMKLRGLPAFSNSHFSVTTWDYNGGMSCRMTYTDWSGNEVVYTNNNFSSSPVENKFYMTRGTRVTFVIMYTNRSGQYTASYENKTNNNKFTSITPVAIIRPPCEGDSYGYGLVTFITDEDWPVIIEPVMTLISKIDGSVSNAFKLDIKVSFSGGNKGHLAAEYPRFRVKSSDSLLTYPFNNGLEILSAPTDRISIMFLASDLSSSVTTLFNLFTWLGLVGTANSGYAVLTGSLSKVVSGVTTLLDKYENSKYYSGSKFSDGNSATWGGWNPSKSGLANYSAGRNTLTLNTVMQSDAPYINTQITVEFALNQFAVEVNNNKDGIILEMIVELYVDDVYAGDMLVKNESGTYGGSSIYIDGIYRLYGVYTLKHTFKWKLISLYYKVDTKGSRKIDSIVFVPDGNLLTNGFSIYVGGTVDSDNLEGNNHPATQYFGSVTKDDSYFGVVSSIGLTLYERT
jgi:hypothetical protein